MPRHKKILHEQFLKKQDVFRFEEVRKTTKCLRSKKKGHYGRYICKNIILNVKMAIGN